MIKKHDKIATDQGDDGITGCQLDCPYSKKHYTMQQALNADPKANQQTNFTRNLEQDGN